MPFYYYNQNNSGGSFDAEYGYGLYVEANTAAEADARATEVGVYFNGCDDGRDCSCCGDRWHEADGEPDAENVLALRTAVEDKLEYARGWDMGIGLLPQGAREIVLVHGVADMPLLEGAAQLQLEDQ